MVTLDLRALGGGGGGGVGVGVGVGGGGADQVLMTCVYPYDIAAHAPNYGDRVPVDTTPGPVPMYRALKNTPHQLINAMMSCPTRQISQRVQPSELDCLLHDGNHENLHDENNRDIGQKVT